MLWSSFLLKVCFAIYKSRSKICFRRLNTKVRWKVFTKLALKKLYKVWYKLIIYICHICHICEIYVWNLKMLYILQNHDTEGRSRNFCFSAIFGGCEIFLYVISKKGGVQPKKGGGSHFLVGSNQKKVGSTFFFFSVLFGWGTTFFWWGPTFFYTFLKISVCPTTTKIFQRFNLK